VKNIGGLDGIKLIFERARDLRARTDLMTLDVDDCQYVRLLQASAPRTLEADAALGQNKQDGQPLIAVVVDFAVWGQCQARSADGGWGGFTRADGWRDAALY